MNCARDEEEQNVEAFPCHGNIYYCTTQNINPGSELLTWYGTEFARNLGISVECSTGLCNFCMSNHAQLLCVYNYVCVVVINAEQLVIEWLMVPTIEIFLTNHVTVKFLL